MQDTDEPQVLKAHEAAKASVENSMQAKVTGGSYITYLCEDIYTCVLFSSSLL